MQVDQSGHHEDPTTVAVAGTQSNSAQGVPVLEGPPAHPSPSRDFLSAEFNPLAALYDDTVEPPVAEAIPLDNVSKCRAILPPELPESLANQAPTAPQSKVCEQMQEQYLQPAVKHYNSMHQAQS